MTTAARVGKLRGTSRETDRERAVVLRDVARRLLELHGIGLELHGALPLGPAVLVSNHVSWLDPFVVASLMPCVPVSKADVYRWPVVGALAQELGVIFIQRGDVRSGARVLRAMRCALAHDLPVLNFPEGTTTEGRTVLPFRKGVFGLAQSAGVPVIPIALAYDPPELAWVGDAAFLPHWLELAGSRCQRALVRLGRPIPADAHSTAAALANAARAEVVRLLEENLT